MLGGSIDNRVKGKTALKIDFTNHTSSLIMLQGRVQDKKIRTFLQSPFYLPLNMSRLLDMFMHV